jgi:hypothetical protein
MTIFYRRAWEEAADKVGAIVLENKDGMVATVRGVIVGRWSNATRSGEIKRSELPVRKAPHKVH